MQLSANVRRVPLVYIDPNKDNDWLIIPGSKIRYYCDGDNNNYYFDYSTDPAKPSFHFTKNIKELIITCNGNG